MTKKVVLIGFGRIAQIYPKVIEKFPDLTLNAVVDTDPESLKAAENMGLKTFSSIAKLFDKTSVDLGIVCTPPSYHFEQGKILLENNVHCLIEKPLALTAKKARLLSEIAGNEKLVLSVSSKFKHTPGLIEVATRIKQGEIGELIHIENTFSGTLCPNECWRSQKTTSGGGVWMDNGPHSLDVLKLLGGSLDSIRMVTLEHQQKTEVEDEVSVRFRHQNGVESHVFLSWNGTLQNPLVLCRGTEGEIRLGWNELEIKKGSKISREAFAYNKEEVFYAVVEAFLNCIEKNENEEALWENNGWIEAGYKSFGENTWKRL